MTKPWRKSIVMGHLMSRGMPCRPACACAILAAAGLTASGMGLGLPACGYDIEFYIPPNCGPSKVYGVAAAINEAGVAVGWIEGCPNPQAYKGFVWWPNGGVQIITFPGASTTQAVGINNSNQVLLRLGIIGQGYVPAVWEAGVVTLCERPEWANQSETGGINDFGVVTGQYGDVVVGPFPLAAIWQDGKLTDISGAFPQPSQAPTGINNVGQIVGTLSDGPVPESGNAERAFLYHRGEVVDLGVAPGCVNSHATDISQAGHIAVYGHTSVYKKGLSNTHPWLGFVWHEGMWTKLASLPGHEESQPRAVNSSGDAIGYSIGAPGDKARVIWVAGEPHDLKTLIPAPPSALSFMKDISDAGVIVGAGWKSSGERPARLLPRARPTADLNEDCAVNASDLAAVLRAWGPRDSAASADINGDGQVDGADLGLLLEQWTG